MNFCLPDGRRGNVHGQSVFSGKHGCSADMVGVFVRNKQRLYPRHGQIQSGHPSLYFTTGNTRIYQYRILFISYIVAIAITAGIKRSDKESHTAKELNLWQKCMDVEKMAEKDVYIRQNGHFSL